MKINLHDYSSILVSVTDTEPMETAIKPKRVAKGPKEPPAFEFSSDTPSISAQDVDIIKLTAMFVARNGRQFMAQLAQREARNYQFDFLRPNHNLFGYFSELIQQYTKILVPNAEGQEKLKQNIEGRKSKLEACIVRMEWMKHLESSRKEKEEREKAEQGKHF